VVFLKFFLNIGKGMTYRASVASALINDKCIGHGKITKETIIDGMHPKGPR
jgi:hypothetical protein